MVLKRSIKDPKGAVDFLYKRGIWKADHFMSKKMYGNASGFLSNFVGRKKLTKDNLKPSKFRDNGYDALGIPYENDLIEKIVSKYNKLITDDKYALKRFNNDEVYRIELKNASKVIPELGGLINKKITTLLEDYYGSHFAVKVVSCWRNYNIKEDYIKGTKKEFFSSRWHCDRLSVEKAKLFVNLTDVTEKDGPLHLQPRPRTKELIKMGFGSREDYKLSQDILEDPKHVIKAVGPKGSAIFANTSFCFHRAGIPEPGHYRDIVEFVFVPSSEPLAENWIEHIDPEFDDGNP